MAEQDQYLETFSASIEELSSSAHEISSINQSVLKQGEASRRDTEDGATCVQELRQVTEVFTSQQKDFNNVLDLMQSVRQATNIIDTIVFQTSLLSFNASVEAERAGESGRGFSIVAQEIKQLAESSQKASNDISKKIELCISAVESLVSGLSKGIDCLASNTDITYRKFDNIKMNANSLTRAVQEITEGTAKQSLAVNSSLQELNRFTALNERNSRFSVISVAEITQELEKSLGQITETTQRSLMLVGAKSEGQTRFWHQIDRLLGQIKNSKDLHSALQLVAQTIPHITQWTISHVFLPDQNNILHTGRIWSHLTDRERTSEFFYF
jgi:methyl-accepting chemotaxis protein